MFKIDFLTMENERLKKELKNTKAKSNDNETDEEFEHIYEKM